MISKILYTLGSGAGVIITTDFLIIELNVITVILLAFFTVMFSYGFIHSMSHVRLYCKNKHQEYISKKK